MRMGNYVFGRQHDDSLLPHLRELAFLKIIIIIIAVAQKYVELLLTFLVEAVCCSGYKMSRNSEK